MAKKKKNIPQYGTVTRKGVLYYRTRILDADGKQVSLYGTTCEELYDKEQEARRQVAEIIFHREHPTVAEYCEKWLLMQSAKVSPATLKGYRGFSMVLAYDGRSNEYRITLKGTLSHTVTLGADVFGNITRLDNALENLAGSLQAEQNSLEETKTQLENARTELAAPFAREEELAEKTARLKELNILLNMDEKDKTLLDDTPDEGEDVPARRVAELAR